MLKYISYFFDQSADGYCWFQYDKSEKCIVEYFSRTLNFLDDYINDFTIRRFGDHYSAYSYLHDKVVEFGLPMNQDICEDLPF